ncbi:hypothetical protein EXIGLDRAFT_665497 [Exidia glandulosa HHB12029]|uniref:Thioesterase domain-containing protein n=1 Tax=Exidia glandulosa HHB12029 TaxID=1314781 RepID=A0A165PPV8_EXIGL|nr:hypothetical protein EXIGLDRAFT_665497 [Exidia glandulosa HHB12029]
MSVSITGNARDEYKSRLWSQYQDTVRRRKDRFAYDIAARIVIKDAQTSQTSSTVVSECVIEQDMLNAGGKVHGACLAYLVDLCTTFALQLHSLENGGAAPEGVTQALNVVYHAPATIGTKLRIACTSLSVDDKTMSGKCEIWDADNKRLVASGLQVKSTSIPAKL